VSGFGASPGFASTGFTASVLTASDFGTSTGFFSAGFTASGLTTSVVLGASTDFTTSTDF